MNTYKLICESYDFFQEGWFGSKPGGYWKREWSQFCRRIELYINDSNVNHDTASRQNLIDTLNFARQRLSENLSDFRYKLFFKLNSDFYSLNEMLKRMYP